MQVPFCPWRTLPIPCHKHHGPVHLMTGHALSRSFFINQEATESRTHRSFLSHGATRQRSGPELADERGFSGSGLRRGLFHQGHKGYLPFKVIQGKGQKSTSHNCSAQLAPAFERVRQAAMLAFLGPSGVKNMPQGCSLCSNRGFTDAINKSSAKLTKS